MNLREEETFLGLRELDLHNADLFLCKFEQPGIAAWLTEATFMGGGTVLAGVIEDGERVNLEILGVLLGLILIEFFDAGG